MYSFNYIYRNKEHLKDFILKKNINSYKNILVQIFSGIIDENSSINIASTIKSLLPQANIIGTTTAGEIANGKIYEHTVLINFSIFEYTKIDSILVENYEADIEKILKNIVFEDTKALIIFSNGLKIDGDEIIKEISRLKPDLLIAGGKAGDNGEFKKTYVFNEKIATEEGFIVASLTSKNLEVYNKYLLSWKPIGKEMLVTTAKKNRVYKINHQKAVDVYKKYLGEDVAKNLLTFGVEFPLILKKKNLYVARVPLAVFEDGSILFGGNIKTGSKVQFGFGSIEAIKKEAYKKYKELLDTSFEAIYIYSCVGRKLFLKEAVEYELQLLENIALTTGFFTYGEFFHNYCLNEVLNMTNTFLAIKETNSVLKREDFKINVKENLTLKALTHLIEVTSKELSESYEILNESQKIAKLGSWELNLENKTIWWSDFLYELLEKDKLNFNPTLEAILDSIEKKEEMKKCLDEMLKGKKEKCVFESKLLDFKYVKVYLVRKDNKIIGILDDITEMKEKEERLRELKEKALEASKIKSAFLANMSHEIRTPLSAIVGFIELLEEECKENKNAEHYLYTIKNASESLLQIINDILDFSKIESGKLEIDNYVFDAKREFQTIANLFEARASSKNINLILEVDNLPEALVSDPLRIKRIIANLLSNAIKFTSRGKNIKVKIFYKKGYLFVSVKDEGIGIPKEKLKRIFNAFTQADNSTTRKYGGTGLGLAISAKLVKMLGGKLKVKSKVGKGSEFYFAIPVKIGKLEKKKEFKENLDFKDKKVLLVEDNEANQLFMKILLSKLGLKFDIAKDGLEALEKFKQNKYDVILIDENMPNMNGIKATEKIREYEKENNLPCTPIIALTANAMKGDRKRFLNAGMDEYLTKPISKKDLIHIFAKFLK